MSPIVAALRGGAQRVLNEDALPPNFGVLHGIDAVSGASPLRLVVFERLRDGLAEHPALFRQLLAVTDRVTHEADPGPGAANVLAMGEGAAKVYLHRYELASPYAWPVHHAERVDDDAAALARMTAADFNPSSEVVLMGAGVADGRVAVSEGAAEGAAFQTSEVTVVSRDGGEITAVMRSDRPGWLVFSEIYYPAWRAVVGNTPVALERADVALMAVAVPAGTHTVKLVYEPRLVIWGISISALSALVAAALGAGGWYRSSRRGLR